MKTYLTKDTMTKALRLFLKVYYYFWWIPLRYYVLATLYGKVSPSYQGAHIMMGLDKVNKKPKKDPEYQEFLRQKEITETYYNTLQKLKEQNQ